MTADEIAEAAARLAATAPPLTAEQRRRLAQIVTSATEVRRRPDRRVAA